MALRTIRTYRTVSAVAALTLAGMIPFDHLARAYADIYWVSRRSYEQVQEPTNGQEGLKQKAMLQARSRWKQDLEQTGAARNRVAGAILPNWERWMEAGPALLTFRITQVLTGHGCFGEYLKRIGAEPTTVCHHCDAELDSAQHTTEECKTFEEQRKKLTEVIGRDLSPAALVTALLAGDREREAITSFCEEVMSIKEAAERERERRARDRRGMNRCRHPAGIQGQTR